MKLTVKDIIDYITENNLSPNSELLFTMDSGCCGDIEPLEPYDIDDYGKRDGNITTIIIRFEPLPGYRSCSEAGITKRNNE